MISGQSLISEDIGGPLITDRVIHLVRQDINKSISELAPFRVLERG